MVDDYSHSLLDWFPNLTGDFNMTAIKDKVALRQAIVTKAVSHLGDIEVPDFSNDGEPVRTFLRYVGINEPAAWCAAFACYVIGSCLTESGYQFGDSTLLRTASCVAIASHARSNGTLVSATDVSLGRYKLLPGDLMLMWEPGMNGYHHTGIIEAVYGDGSTSFTTVEGNTCAEGHTGNQREGDRVARHHRSAQDPATDGHAKYAFVRTL